MSVLFVLPETLPTIQGNPFSSDSVRMILTQMQMTASDIASDEDDFLG